MRDSEGESESRTEKWSRTRERGKQSKIDRGEGGGGQERQTDRQTDRERNKWLAKKLSRCGFVIRKAKQDCQRA